MSVKNLVREKLVRDNYDKVYSSHIPFTETRKNALFRPKKEHFRQQQKRACFLVAVNGIYKNVHKKTLKPCDSSILYSKLDEIPPYVPATGT